ncbi:MAG: methyltransferase domain-containing protein [Spirochaetaceae bacterium]|nr:MAG: methyltransferase domain-containing protein [Spirochaetaceae bacterium]
MISAKDAGRNLVSDRGWYAPRRLQAGELMDDPASDRRLLERTLTQLELINRLLSRARALLRRYVIDDMRARGARRATVLDVGAGGGDIALWLVRQAAHFGLQLRTTCLDRDERVVEFARRRLRGEQAVEVVHGSALEITGQWDYVLCNHFLHHLDEAEIELFLDLSFEICRRRLLINDLLRSNWSLAGFRIVSALLLHGSFARHDGIVSIQRGFRPSELDGMVRQCRWNGQAQVGKLLPGRVYLVGTRT